jgi:hypothetical protein
MPIDSQHYDKHFNAIHESSIKNVRRREIQYFEHEANKLIFEEMNDKSIERVE